MNIKRRHILKSGSGLSGWFLFMREMLREPGKIGAALPSSQRLSRKMAQQLPDSKSGVVVELGGGSGVVTKALLEQGIEAQRLIIFERSFILAAHLRQQFPEVRIICGDARYISKYLHDPGLHVTAIVSSLPLRSMPEEVLTDISLQLQKCLIPGSVFIQFTYSWFRNYEYLPKKLQHMYALYVWANLPPARIDVFQFLDL